MANLHYHVGVNTVGYLPEGDVSRFETKGDALSEAKRIKDEILSEGYGPMRPEGECLCEHHRSEHYRSKGRCSSFGCGCTRFDNVGIRSSGRDGDYYLGDSHHGHLDVHVWVQSCESDDCEEVE